MRFIFTQAFRFFFPMAALFAALSVMLWLAGLSGMAPLPAQPTLWHAHEMVFGFGAAVITGFVLTAVANWTGRQPAQPWMLATLAALWVLARVVALPGFATAPELAAALFNGLFLAGLAGLMSHVLIVSANRRNAMFIPLLWALTLSNALFHLYLYRDQVESARQLLMLTVYLLGFLMVFMGGRVIPFFTSRRCGYAALEYSWLNWTSTLAALCSAFALSLFPASEPGLALSAAAALATLLRWLLWQPWRVWREPMLWILHLGYAWLVVAFILAAGVHGGALDLPPTAPIHALMTGALGCLGLGMMARVALGHSGRKIETSPILLIAFLLMAMAGLLRITSYADWALGGLSGLTLSAILWSTAFALYAVQYFPLLWRRT